MVEPEAHAYTDGGIHWFPWSRRLWGRHDVEGEDRRDQRRRVGHNQPKDGACRRLRRPGDHRRRAYSDRVLRLLLPRYLHEESLAQEVARERLAQPPQRTCSEQGSVERLLEATQRHQEVRWRKVKGHSKTGGTHKSGNDRADELAVAAKKEARRPSTPSPP